MAQDVLSASACSEAVGDALERLYQSCGDLLYERYLAAKEADFVSRRTLQDLQLLVGWELPTVCCEYPARPGRWAVDAEPTPAPLDTWTRAALPLRAASAPRRDLAQRRATTAAEDAAARATAAVEAAARTAAEAVSAARREAALLPLSSKGAPSPSRRSAGAGAAGAAVSRRSGGGSGAPSPARAMGAGGRSLSREGREDAKAAARRIRELEKRLKGQPYTLDERGGVLLVERVAPEDMPAFSPQAQSSVEDVGGEGVGGGWGARRGGAGGSGGGGGSWRGAGGAGSAGKVGSPRSPDGGSVTSLQSHSVAGGGGLGNRSTRQAAAKDDPRFFKETLVLPQPSMLAALALEAAAGEDVPPGAPRLAVSPGVAVREGGRTFVGAPRAGDAAAAAPSPHSTARPQPLEVEGGAGGAGAGAAPPQSSSGGAPASGAPSPLLVNLYKTAQQLAVGKSTLEGLQAAAALKRGVPALASAPAQPSPLSAPATSPGAPGSARALVTDSYAMLQSMQPQELAQFLSRQEQEATLLQDAETFPYGRAVER
jgi:hypothetical protein